MRSWSLACTGPRMALKHVEASRAECPAQLGRWPLVGLEYGVIELLDCRALEAEEDAAAWTEDTSELGEGDVNGLWLVMDELVPGKQTTEGPVPDTERIDVADFEGDSGVLVASVGDQVSRQVDA